MVSLHVVDHKDMDLSAAMLVIGFPSTGYVGTISTNFLVDSFNLEHVASVMSDDFPPMAVVRDGVSFSPMRIYAAPMVCGVDGKCNQLAVVVSEIGPKPQNAYPLGRALLDWAKEKRVKEVVCVEGTHVEAGKGEGAQLYGVAGSAEALRRVKELKVTPLTEGVVSGITGVLLHLSESVGVDVLCVLATTEGQQQDARASAQILDLLQPLVPKLKIDPEPLHRQAELMDSQIKKMVQRHQETMKDLSEQSRIMYG